MGEKLMGNISETIVTILVVLGIFVMGAFMFLDANSVSPSASAQQFATFNKTQAYSSNLENQTTVMQGKLAQAENSGSDPIASLNLFYFGGTTAAVAALGLIGIPLAVVYDIGTVLGIPAIFVALSALGLLILFVFQIIRAIRWGDM
jgi:hypothetical protein